MANNSFGRRIAQARQKMKLSQRAAAAEIGADQAWLCRVEKGQHNPSAQSIIRLQSFYGALLAPRRRT